MAILEPEIKSMHDSHEKQPDGLYEQVTDFRSGNEMAARAAAQINYHVMGYFPITPSTEIAEYLDEMKTRGEHDIVMIPADGEHGAAGICFGASAGGGRVFNATSAQGFLYMLEQLPAQAGARLPMVMNLVTRAVTGPLDIRGDHSDLYHGLNIGWPILLARDPQAVYDMNIMALKVAEHADVRLPVLVASDGFFTSHSKRRVHYFKNRDAVEQFVGPMPRNYHHVLDPKHPITMGPYMNDPDQINSRYQHSLAMYEVERVYDQIAEAYARLSGRSYPKVEAYKMEGARVALFILNSAAETSKDVTDELREKGLPVGVVSPNLLRPFPKKAIADALAGVEVVLVAERADELGAHGANLTHEIQAVLQEVGSRAKVICRVYGTGGREFYPDDAEALFQLALSALNGEEVASFDYYGVNPGDPDAEVAHVRLQPLTKEETSGFVSVEKEESTGELKVKVPSMRALTGKAKRVAPGHGACPGCGIFPGIETFLKGIEGDVVVLYQTGCAQVTTTGYPYTSHRVNFLHNLFQNGGATLSGTVEMYFELKRRGEIDTPDDPTFVMVSGDGGMDIGLGSALGAAMRNHKMIILEYDNEGYMNTGAQLSYSTPLGHMTSTSGVGPGRPGKSFQHKDMPQLMVAANVPYVFTGVEAFAMDLVRKGAKAQWYAQHEGLAYGKILISCPLNWKAADDAGNRIVGTAVKSCFFPLYEVEHGVTRITYNPEEKDERVPVEDWLSMMGKSKHLLKAENTQVLQSLKDEVERRWMRLKAKHDNPLL